ncbi:MAG TPA: TlpA disulfide reductase family protein, partial [Saprospiraceae bacterium]|nr:TlpA disulfide reductase family protein [Saprospiraceae bacterium]
TMTCYADIIKGVLNKPLQSADEAKTVIQKGCTPLMQAFLTSQLLGNNPGPFMADFKKSAQNLSAAMPNSKYATDYAAMITQVETQLAQMQAGGGSGESEGPIQIGQAAPEISLPDPSGKTRSLSALKGKVVLLDFWASWCGPCRRENPHVVEVYNKYKSKGFEVFSVSLDGVDPRTSRGMSAEQVAANKESGKQRWQEAIKKDGLIWENHVSDLQHWGSAPAAVYGVSSIPKTFLIGRDGKVVAINPRANLEEALLKVL